ncbi:Transcription initiation factor TFIID subunit 12 [Mycoblastus sanguinarius]|nr:Transcription initiation factor TFIID subunit 12 [Mycoblastus sanguinarius]
MNITNSQVRQGQSALPLESLIKADQINKLPYFPEHQKAKYHNGVTRLWETLNSQPKDSLEWQHAYSKLVDVSLSIKNSMNQNKTKADSTARAAATAQQNGSRPMSSGQPGQQPQAPHVQPGSAGQPQAPEQSFPPRVVEKVKSLNVLVPPSITAQGQDATARWVRDAKSKYAHYLQAFDQAKMKLNALDQTKNRRESQGKPFDQREAEMYRTQLAMLNQSFGEAKDYLMTFQQQQNNLKTQQIQSQVPGAGDGADQSGDFSTQTVKVEPNQSMGGQHQNPQEPHGQPHTVSSALDAARNQQSPGVRSQMSPHNTGPVTQPPMSQAPNSRPQPQGQMPNSHPPLNINTNNAPPEQNNSPRVAPSQPSTAQEPRPLSHQAAMEHARSYSNQNYGQPTPQSATHGHPQGDPRNQREQSNNHQKMPIPKDLNIAPVQPVSIGPSRPTLTNGPIAMGPIGQPAIQKHPGYVLEGEGERVLSKKKLEELVRQVTGGTGGEGEEGEGLTAEVEETLLQVADDFVDQVIVAACKLAKLRQSSTLELRDLQLILERNYNIRVPGYASDELRTVKKMQPTPAWTQKLSAVQAAKVTGGKGDL